MKKGLSSAALLAAALAFVGVLAWYLASPAMEQAHTLVGQGAYLRGRSYQPMLAEHGEWIFRLLSYPLRFFLGDRLGIASLNLGAALFSVGLLYWRVRKWGQGEGLLGALIVASSPALLLVAFGPAHEPLAVAALVALWALLDSSTLPWWRASLSVLAASIAAFSDYSGAFGVVALVVWSAWAANNSPRRWLSLGLSLVPVAVSIHIPLAYTPYLVTMDARFGEGVDHLLMVVGWSWRLIPPPQLAGLLIFIVVALARLLAGVGRRRDPIMGLAGSLALAGYFDLVLVREPTVASSTYLLAFAGGLVVVRVLVGATARRSEAVIGLGVMLLLSLGWSLAWTQAPERQRLVLVQGARLDAASLWNGGRFLALAEIRAEGEPIYIGRRIPIWRSDLEGYGPRHFVRPYDFRLKFAKRGVLIYRDQRYESLLPPWAKCSAINRIYLCELNSSKGSVSKYKWQTELWRDPWRLLRHEIKPFVLKP